MTTSPKPEPPKDTFFLDRTHGKRTARILDQVGLVVERHNKYFDKEESDSVWLKRCGEENWIVLSGDKRLETVPENRHAVITHRCKVFIFSDMNKLPEEYAAAVVMGRKKMAKIIKTNVGPFWVTVDTESKSHITNLRHGPGGHEVPEAEIVEESAPMAAMDIRGTQPTEKKPIGVQERLHFDRE